MVGHLPKSQIYFLCFAEVFCYDLLIGIRRKENSDGIADATSL